MKCKTSEAIAMLEKNKKLKFKSQYNEIMKIVCDRLSNIHGEALYVCVDREWELIQQPVTFMEAVKAYSEGKTIRCEYVNGKQTYTPAKCIEPEYSHMKDGLDRPVTPIEILTAKWYVEESENA